MPFGCFSHVPDVAHLLMTRRPTSVLDLGIGFGFYGSVVRQWLDQGMRPFRTYLVGVEAWSDYRSPLWDLYNVVVQDTIESFLLAHPAQYDMILLMDVLEHFTSEQGHAVLQLIRQQLSPVGCLIVGTPAIFVPQDAVHGNPHERHRSLWTAQDLAAAGLDILDDGRPDRFGNQMVLALLHGGT